jgi:hypothetical protein
MKTYRCTFTAARNVTPPNFYDTDRFSGAVIIEAENEAQAREEAISAVYNAEEYAAECVGHVRIVSTEDMNEPDLGDLPRGGMS